ncbi:hypothetical protein GCM10009639_50800 [Kitasatospora putterlickiae]|uniref:Uncharacterized protein n=1 Tax=Kitasatospora putterlickiae TaxID=221725 RepID=A0ABN1YCY3_9ACTN
MSRPVSTAASTVRPVAGAFRSGSLGRSQANGCGAGTGARYGPAPGPAPSPAPAPPPGGTPSAAGVLIPDMASPSKVGWTCGNHLPGGPPTGARNHTGEDTGQRGRSRL